MGKLGEQNNTTPSIRSKPHGSQNYPKLQQINTIKQQRRGISPGLEILQLAIGVDDDAAAAAAGDAELGSATSPSADRLCSSRKRWLME